MGDPPSNRCRESGTDPSNKHFTGKLRDQDTGLDYFGARYYASVQGRFLTPDWSATPEAVPYGHFETPQSLNLYAYVKNNPVTDVDVDGHQQGQPDPGGFTPPDNTFDPRNNGGKGPADGQQAQPGPTTPPPAQQQQPADQSLTNVVYNETGSGRADANAKPGAPGSAEDLANGRQAVAEIANRVINAGHPDRVASSDLTNKAAAAVKKDPNAIDAYNKSRTAADAALNGSNISNGATQYRTRVGNDVTTPVGKSRTNPGTPVSQHYGPFIEGNHTFVIVVAQ